MNHTINYLPITAITYFLARLNQLEPVKVVNKNMNQINGHL